MTSVRFYAQLALGAFLLLASAARSSAVTSLGDGYNPTLTRDGLYLYYRADDATAAPRIKRTLALGTEVTEPPPALPGINSFPSGIRDFPAFTPNGRYIAFSTSDALVPGDTNEQYDVYVMDTMTNAVSRVSLGNNGQQGFGGFDGAQKPSMSDDGRYVVFSSSFSNLVAGDSNGTYSDVFVRDRCVSNGTDVPSCTTSTVLVSLGPGGIQSDGDCELATSYGAAQFISADGRWVAFDCWATQSVIASFTPGHTCNDPFACVGAYVRDLCVSNGAPVPSCTPATELVTLGPGGAFPNQGAFSAVISGDGTRVVYISTATDIVAESGSGVTYDIFLYDRNTGMTRRLSTPPLTGNTGFAETSISGDGLRVAYRLGPQYSREMFLWADCAILNPTCGDNALEPGCEECDDGNLVDGDGCDSNCTVTRCENGATSTGEECDDGNPYEGDGCDSNCTVTRCGNDIRTAGEACDDGNTTPGDGCSATCAIEPDQLTPGGTGKSDCVHEWIPYRQPPKNAKGIPKAILECHDDDPACDFDDTPGDNVCVFRLGLCANVTDPRLACTPIDVAAVDISKPKADNPTDPYADFNWGTLAFELEQLGGFYTGHCLAPPVNVGDTCLDKFDCDDQGGDGRCSKPVFEFSPPLTATNQCADYSDVVVPVKEVSPGIFKPGVATLKLKAFASNDPLTGKPRKTDADTLKLVCNPAP